MNKVSSIVPDHGHRRIFLSGAATLEGAGRTIDCVSLGDLIDTREPVDMQLEAEVLSGMVVDGGRAARLGLGEWWKKVRRASTVQPSFISDRWGHDEIVAWHRNQQMRAIQDGNSYALRWHTEQLARVQGRSNDLQGDLARLFPEATKVADGTSGAPQENAGQPEEPPYSKWLLRDRYQSLFESKDADGFYPADVRGTILGNQPLFRARFVPKPQTPGFGFRSFHGISESEYRRRIASYERDGFRELFLHSFEDAAGDLRYSGTWVRD